jgi:hypothetical protein
MRRTTTIVLMLGRLLGALALAMGITFSTGHAGALIPLHMLAGVLFVLCLWIVAVLSLIGGSRRGLAAFSILWGFVVPALGVGQYQLLPGPHHWVISVLHALVGIAALALAEMLAKGIRGLPQAA